MRSNKNYLHANQEKKEADAKWASNVRNKIFWGAITITFVYWFFPEFIPYKPWVDFWRIEGTVMDWMISTRYVFFWAIGAGTLLTALKVINKEPSKHSFIQVFLSGTFISLKAGVFEEILFRWIIFLGAMPALYIGNWILGGFLGSDWGIIQWLHNTITGPLANFFTMELLSHQILHTCWYAGAAIIVSNTLFRDGHRYQGWKGWINSWFLGMCFFYIMFAHGMLAAIFVHFLYDFILFIIEALSVPLRPRQRSLF